MDRDKLRKSPFVFVRPASQDAAARAADRAGQAANDTGRAVQDKATDLTNRAGQAASDAGDAVNRTAADAQVRTLTEKKH